MFSLRFKVEVVLVVCGLSEVVKKNKVVSNPKLKFREPKRGFYLLNMFG